MSWTEDRVEMLKRLWADGLSASQIAGELGGVNRNAVIGKVHRLGLSGRIRKGNLSAPKAKRERRERMPSRLLHNFNRTRGAAAPAVMPVEPVGDIEQMEIPVQQRKTLMQLTDKVCHWPVGDPCTEEFYFCGGVTDGERPYCAPHCLASYQPARARA